MNQPRTIKARVDDVKGQAMDVKDQTVELLNAQMALAKAELQPMGKNAGAGAGLLGGAGVVSLYGLGIVLLAAAAGLHEGLGLPVWASLLIVAGVLFLLALILALIARSKLKRVGPPVKTIESFKRLQAVFQGAPLSDSQESSQADSPDIR